MDWSVHIGTAVVQGGVGCFTYSQCEDYLPCFVLCEPSFLHQMLVQLATLGQLEHEVKPLLALKPLLQAHHMTDSTTTQHRLGQLGTAPPPGSAGLPSGRAARHSLRVSECEECVLALDLNWVVYYPLVDNFNRQSFARLQRDSPLDLAIASAGKPKPHTPSAPKPRLAPRPHYPAARLDLHPYPLAEPIDLLALAAAPAKKRARARGRLGQKGVIPPAPVLSGGSCVRPATRQTRPSGGEEGAYYDAGWDHGSECMTWWSVTGSGACFIEADRIRKRAAGRGAEWVVVELAVRCSPLF